jgi:hypothetical protein
MRLWGKIPPGLVLGVFALLGVGLIVVPHYWAWQRDYGITSEIGVAFLVAAILGFTIDRWLKAELRDETFLAAIGQILEPEFRAEVSRIIGYKLICESHHLLVEIETTENGLVRVTTSLERKIRNKSAYPEEIQNMAHIDEWGLRQAGKSEIIECTLNINGDVVSAGDPKTDAYTVLRETEKRTLKPNQTAILRGKWVEYKSTNDALYYHFAAPTINPEIEVRGTKELDCNFGFGTPNVNIVTLAYAPRKQMIGTYFPHQAMNVRWWPKPGT